MLPWLRKHKKVIIIILLTAIAILFYFGYTITGEKEIKPLIDISTPKR